MKQIDVFTLTDADLERMEREGLLPKVAIPTITEYVPRRRPAVLHRCSRCGIDSERADLCIDCLDVLALEAS